MPSRRFVAEWMAAITSDVMSSCSSSSSLQDELGVPPNVVMHSWGLVES